MPETTQSIGQWIEETFPGADPESPRKAIRALEEMVELCLASGATAWDIQEAVIRALKSEFDGALAPHYTKPNPGKIPAEAADVAIVLHGLAHMRGFDLQAEIDKKMAVNRSRKWRALGDGTGYHIRETAECPCPPTSSGSSPPTKNGSE